MVAMMLRLAALLVFVVGSVIAAPTTTLPIKQVYVLGDSLSDQGNLLFATTDLGPALGLPPIPASDHYYMGRFSNGENYVGLLAQKLGVSVQPSELGGTNFAFGGSRTDYNRVEFPPGVPGVPNVGYPAGAYPWSLNLQREAFVEHARNGHADPTGLYIVFAGSNDLSDALTALLVHGDDPTPTIAKAVQGVVDVVLAFRSAGARTILVPLTPNLGLVPSVTAFGLTVAHIAQGLSQQFNAALVTHLATISGPNIIVFDTFSFLTEIVSHPGDFGLNNVTAPCYSGFVYPNPFGVECAEPDKYAFWDVEHPTTRLNAILADELFATVLHCAGKGTGRFTAHCAVNKH